MAVRGIRGATTADENTRESIIASTQEMLAEILTQNALVFEDIAAAFFTTTHDLNATFPALAARLSGWTDVPLMNSHEMEVPGSLARCVRVMLLVNTDKTNREIKHVYLRDAVGLRERVARDLG